LRLLFNDPTPMDVWLAPHFQVPYLKLDRPSQEYMHAAINVNAASVYLSGRFGLFPHRGSLRAREFVLATLLRDPFEELAVRLVTLNGIAERGGPQVVAGMSGALRGAADFAARAAEA